MSNTENFANPILIAQLSSDPANPTNGQMYYNTVSNVYRVYQNGAWANLSVSTPLQKTVQIFTTPGSGTYTLPSNPTPFYLRVRMIGGGGGGGGGGASTSTNGNSSVASSFGNALISLPAGPGGGAGANHGTGGSNGALPTANLPSISVVVTRGLSGQTAGNFSGSSVFGGSGASSPFGGGALGGVAGSSPGTAGIGGGGGGGSHASSAPGGGGGGAGTYIEAIIPNPSTIYSFTIASTYNATIWAVYTINGLSFTVTRTMASATVLYTSGTAKPPTTGTLTLSSGTGSASIPYSAFAHGTFPFVVSTGGNGGNAGTGGTAGSAGGNGMLIVEEYYQ